MRPALSLLATVLAGTTIRLIIRRLSRRRPPPKPPQHAQIISRLNIIAPAHKPTRNAHADNECTFCLDAIHNGKQVRITPCNHAFHTSCLEQWVLFKAEHCLNWRHYSLRDDGKVECLVRKPTCPNCATELQVVPELLIRSVVLVSVARSLSLGCVRAAQEMINAGLVWFDQQPSHTTRSIHTYFPTAIQYPQPTQTTQYPHASTYVRTHTTFSEPSSPTDTDSMSSYSLSEQIDSPITTSLVATRPEQRGWRRAPGLHLAPRVVHATS